MALEALHGGVMAAGNKHELPLEQLELAYRCVLKDDITCISEIRRPHSLNRKLGIKAVPMCELKIECARYYTEFRDRSGSVVASEELFSTTPMGVFNTNKFLRELKWVSNGEVLVVSEVEKDEMIPNIFSNIVVYSISKGVPYDVVTLTDGKPSLVVIHVPFSAY